jgi:hypothetical protein
VFDRIPVYAFVDGLEKLRIVDLMAGKLVGTIQTRVVKKVVHVFLVATRTFVWLFPQRFQVSFHGRPPGFRGVMINNVTIRIVLTFLEYLDEQFW